MEDLKDSRGSLRLQVPTTPRSARVLSVRQSVIQFRANKISWLGSRLDDNDTPKSAIADDDDKFSLRPDSSVTLADEQPRFRKRETSSILELFYDLWVVATLNVFTSAHEITTRDELASFLQYIFLLWTTWFLVVAYDVRFLEDSVVERLTRAVQLGVLLVFVQAAPYFEPAEQTRGVFASLSLVLAFSRLVLAGQYGIVLWQTRYFAQGRTGLVVVLATHVLAASLYAIVSAAFFVHDNSPAYVAWMVVSTFEIVANLVVAMMSRVVSFEGSHLPERLSQLTLVVLGEGVINLARDLTSIERNSQNSWMSWSKSNFHSQTHNSRADYVVFNLFRSTDAAHLHLRHSHGVLNFSDLLRLDAPQQDDLLASDCLGSAPPAIPLRSSSRHGSDEPIYHLVEALRAHQAVCGGHFQRPVYPTGRANEPRGRIQAE